MLVEIITYDPPDAVKKICELTKVCYPHIEVDKMNKNDIRRLIRKLIRDRDVILQTIHIMLRFDCPLFVYQDLRKHAPRIKFGSFNINHEEFAFDTPPGWDNNFTSQMTCLFKKVSSVIKYAKSNNISNDNILYAIPMGSIVNFCSYLDFIEIYDLITTIQNANTYNRTKDLVTELFELMCGEFPQFYSKQNMEIFLANKEN